MPPDLNPRLALINGIAAELAVDPSFVEKDWYAMRLIATLMEVQNSYFQLIFSGGTSLSKGFDLIQRFSEDLDFKVLPLQPKVSRQDRRDFREQLLANIQANTTLWQIDDQDLQSGDSSRFFKIPIQYQPHYQTVFTLRPYLQLEITFEPPSLPPQSRTLRSFVSAAEQSAPEVPHILCISPLEIAADKLSALSWRVLDRDRASPSDDPALVRHLHDLAALAPHIRDDNRLQALALKTLAKDTKRGNSTTASLTIAERLQQMLNILQTDATYATEYQNFVVGMSYASDEDRITFSVALAALQRLTATVLQNEISST